MKSKRFLRARVFLSAVVTRLGTVLFDTVFCSVRGFVSGGFLCPGIDVGERCTFCVVFCSRLRQVLGRENFFP